MVRLIRASLTIAVLLYFISLGSGALASDPAPARKSHHNAVPRPGATLPFTATAYCQRGITQSGVDTHTGIAAADPARLPVGSVVHIQTDIRKYNGIYTVLDTGTKVRGYKVDLFMHDCSEAQHFGTRSVRVTVLRKGWSPKASAPKAVMAGK